MQMYPPGQEIDLAVTDLNLTYSAWDYIWDLHMLRRRIMKPAHTAAVAPAYVRYRRKLRLADLLGQSPEPYSVFVHIKSEYIYGNNGNIYYYYNILYISWPGKNIWLHSKISEDA